jgi:carbonic anhydrase
MNLPGENFDDYVLSKQPGYDEPTFRKEFAKAMPLRTVVVYCYDPRVVDIPAVVAKEFGEVYPGETVTDAHGNNVGTTRSLFEVVVAGGRAIDALRSVTVAQHVFGIENVVIVHHTYCGETSFTTDGIIDAYKHEHENISISDYVKSLNHDTKLMRESKGTPQHANIYGYLFDHVTTELSLVVEDNGIR